MLITDPSLEWAIVLGQIDTIKNYQGLSSCEVITKVRIKLALIYQDYNPVEDSRDMNIFCAGDDVSPDFMGIETLENSAGESQVLKWATDKLESIQVEDPNGEFISDKTDALTAWKINMLNRMEHNIANSVMAGNLNQYRVNTKHLIKRAESNDVEP